MAQYHDTEWGVELTGDAELFEAFTLSGFQAGLSWLIVLRKRDAFRQAFHSFDPAKVAAMKPAELDRLAQNPAIIRNRAKIQATVSNAAAWLNLLREFPSGRAYLARFVPVAPVVNRWNSLKEIPARSAESDALSADLQRRGFKFCGSVICYAFMQAVGLFNDHMVGCFRHSQMKRPAAN